MDVLCVIGLCVAAAVFVALLLSSSGRKQPAQPSSTPPDIPDWNDFGVADEEERPPLYYHRAWMEQQRGGDDPGPPG